MRLRRLRTLVLPAALGALLSGCAASPEEPAQTVRDFYAALARGDFARACALQQQETRELIAQAGGSCEEAMRQTAAELGDPAAVSDPEIDLDKVVVDGDAARVPPAAVSFDGRPSTDAAIDLVRVDGRWYIR